MWQSDGKHQLSTNLHKLRLVVRRFDRCARFIIFEPDETGGARAPLVRASGTADDVGSAIRAARRAALRVRAILRYRKTDGIDDWRQILPHAVRGRRWSIPKYAPLLKYLRRQSSAELVLTFEQIEAIVGGALPASAYSASWWASEKLGLWATRHHGGTWSPPEIAANLLPGEDCVRFRRLRRAGEAAPGGAEAPASAAG